MVVTLLYCILTTAAQIPNEDIIELPLWPDGVPDNAIIHEGQEEETNRDIDQNDQGLNRSITRVSVPTLTVYPAPKDSAVCIGVIICPGGGYARVVIDKEGIDIARQLNDAGITGIVLKYRTWPANVSRDTKEADAVGAAITSDGQQAIRVVRSHARDWNLDPNRIGIMGFSAGGHFALMVSISGNDEISRPDFAGLIYPAIPNNIESQINEQVPPMFIVNAGDEQTTPADRSIGLYQMLRSKNVPAEMHIYSKGGHGFGLGIKGGAVTSWPDLFVNWLKDVK